MATYASRAIVIGRHNLGEADRILVLLTPDQGVIRAVAKGVRRIKSRLAGHLELFCESELMLAKGRNMDVVTSARLQHHLDISADYDRMRQAYLFAEMVNRLSGDSEHHAGLFELVQQAFIDLATSPADATGELWFKLRLLDRLGYRPQLDGCLICGSSNPGQRYRFAINLGGIVDEGCGEGVPISLAEIKLWRLMLTRDLAQIRQVQGIVAAVAATLLLCNQFYDFTFGRRFRSAEVLL